jgi:sphinganine C4-monooxygenase
MNTTTATLPLQYVLREKPSLVAGIPDNIMSLIAPIVAYWSYSTFFYIIDTLELAEKYRIHPPEEVVTRNKATKSDVFKDVVLQHIVQTIVGYTFSKFDGIQYTGMEQFVITKWTNKLVSDPKNSAYPAIKLLVELFYKYGLSFIKIFTAFVIVDSWQYWFHRIMHMNKYLYKRFHSRHHRLYVPYAFGALYNDPVEGFLLDTLGTGLAALITGLTPRESIVLYTFSTLKTVDDHCGYSLPFDPFQVIFPNNSIYHDIHHQQFGIKTNFSQPFFIFWDVLFNTRYHDLDSYKEKQKRITIEKYKEFLRDRKLNHLQRKQEYLQRVEAEKNETKKVK